MIGTVEIYGNYGKPDHTLLLEESNLLVNGAGESICDMLTMPSGAVSAFVGHGSSITDSSNFTVQAISFGKASEAYRNNAHFYPFNLSSYINSKGEFSEYVSIVQADKVIRAVSLVNENIATSPSSYDPKRDPGATPNVNDKQLEPDTRTAIDLVSGQYHVMGNDLMQGRAHPMGQNLNKILSNTNPNLLSFTANPNSDPNTSSGPTFPGAWTSSTGVKAITLKGSQSGPYSDTSAFMLSGTGLAAAVLRQELPLFGTYFHANVDHTFSTYVKLPEENPASSITMIIRDVDTPRNFQVTYGFHDSTTNTFVAPTVGTVNFGAEGRVTPIGSADGSGGWYRLETRLEALGRDGVVAGEGPGASNLNRMEVRITIPAVSNEKPSALLLYGWQLEESYGATEYQEVLGLSPTFSENGKAGDMFLGCYPHTNGTDFAIVSSISNLDTPQDNIIISGTYPSKTHKETYFNSSAIRSMDSNGFVKAYYPSSVDFALDMADPASGLIVSAWSEGSDNFSSLGEVRYVCTISSGDLGLVNMYGGLFKLGLWTVDLEKTLSDTTVEGNPKEIPPFPLRFSAGYNKLVYKLFAEKSLTKNIAKIQDQGVNAGSLAYEDLTIIWKIRFCGDGVPQPPLKY